LVGAEIALSLTIVVGAGLLLRTFWELLHVHPGFRSENVLSATVWLPVPNDPKTDVYATNEQRTALMREWIRRLHTISGVEQAATTSAVPLRNQLGLRPFRAEGRSEQDQPPATYWIQISPEFIRAIGATVLRGRELQEGDDSRVAPAVLVDEAAARRFWGEEDPIGRHIRFANNIFVNGKPQAPPWMTVVGLVSNIKFGRLDEGELPHLYSSAYQFNGKFLSVVVRGTGDPAALGRNIQAQVQAVDPNLPISDVAPMAQVVTASVADRRFAAALIGLFAVLALGLAAVGVYGVAAYTVQQRTREFGIRSALGATKSDLVRMVLRDSTTPVLAGLAFGVVGAALVGRAMSSLLFGVHMIDPLIYVASIIVLALVGISANYIPALRAGKTDPNLALRYE
jgi:putative ABC transport system permease protein